VIREYVLYLLKSIFLSPSGKQPILSCIYDLGVSHFPKKKMGNGKGKSKRRRSKKGESRFRTMKGFYPKRKCVFKGSARYFV